MDTYKYIDNYTKYSYMYTCIYTYSLYKSR